MSSALTLIDDCLNSLPSVAPTTVKPVRIELRRTSSNEQKRDESYPTLVDKTFCDGIPDRNKNFEFVDISDVLNTPLKEGRILVQAMYISVDPYLRGRLYRYVKSNKKSVYSGQVAKVLRSNDSKFKVNDIIFAYLTWESVSIVNTSKVSCTIIGNSSSINELSYSYYLGAYGMPGRTAYHGIIEIGKLRKNSVLLVSGAAGAVGSIAGQIGKIYNCYVIGSAGSKEKCDWMKNSLGFDFVFNYKNYKTKDEMVNILTKAVENTKNKKIDYYFDNTGGLLTDSVWDLLNNRAVVLICGQIAVYNRKKSDGPYMIPTMLPDLVYRAIRIEGFLVGNMSKEYLEKFKIDMKKWILDGKIKVKETIFNGFNKTPDALIGLFKGTNIGKMVVKC